MYKFRGYFVGQSAGMQFLALFLFILSGNFLSSMLGLALSTAIFGEQTSMEQYPDMLRLLQFISAIGTFLLPAWLIAWLFSSQPKEYLQVRRVTDWKLIVYVFAGMLFINPLINLTVYWNESLILPEWAAPIESWMRRQEDTMQHFTELLIHGGGSCPLLANLIIVALTAAVTEEFLFRGALLHIVRQSTRNEHVAIWIVAILFSAFHLQFYGFIPRMLLGAYFGYLLVWSRSIWLPICAHFFNNAWSVIVMSNSKLAENELLGGKITEATASELILPAIVGFIVFILITWSIKKR